MSSSLSDFTKGELLKLVTEEWIGKVTVGIIDAVERSFKTDEIIRPVLTKAEIKFRFDICIKWFVTLRREMGWSVPAILDELPTILRDELDGKYDPGCSTRKELGKINEQRLLQTSSRWVCRQAGTEKMVYDGKDIAGEAPELIANVDAIDS